LGRPDPCKLETEILAVHPPHQGFIDAQRPLLVEKKQRQAEHHAGLNLGKGCSLTAVCREIENRRFTLEVILSKKEQPAIELKTAASTFRRRSFAVRA
jgi:hypothetical protein